MAFNPVDHDARRADVLRMVEGRTETTREMIRPLAEKWGTSTQTAYAIVCHALRILLARGLVRHVGYRYYRACPDDSAPPKPVVPVPAVSAPAVSKPAPPAGVWSLEQLLAWHCQMEGLWPREISPSQLEKAKDAIRHAIDERDRRRKMGC